MCETQDKHLEGSRDCTHVICADGWDPTSGKVNRGEVDPLAGQAFLLAVGVACWLVLVRAGIPVLCVAQHILGWCCCE